MTIERVFDNILVHLCSHASIVEYGHTFPRSGRTLPLPSTLQVSGKATGSDRDLCSSLNFQ